MGSDWLIIVPYYCANNNIPNPTKNDCICKPLGGFLVKLLEVLHLLCICVFFFKKERTKCKYLPLCLQALERFYEAVMQAILRHINFDGSAAAQINAHLDMSLPKTCLWFCHTLSSL